MNLRGLKRENSSVDKFYTCQSVSSECIENLKLKFDENDFDLILEPSAGSGSFSNKIKNCMAIDIEPEHINVKKQDFLKLDLSQFNDKKNILVIGNPPFGRQSTMAKKFIKRSCIFANVIAFILPKSFKKPSMKKAFNCYFHLVFEFDLPNSSFTVNDESHNVPCIFQIWEKKDVKRPDVIIYKPVYFEYVKKTYTGGKSFSFRRVGVNAGRCSINTSVSEQSHYFIHVLDENLDILQIIKNINDKKWEFNNTVGPRSISKQESGPIIDLFCIK